MVTESRPPPGDVLLRAGRTEEFGPTQLQRVRELLDLSFDGDFGEHDWEHALGGVHVLAFRAGTLVGHGSVVERRLLHAERALRTGYVEALAVHPGARRQGIAQRIMGALEEEIARRFEIGALSASDAAVALYRKRGWSVWRGALSAMTAQGVMPTPQEKGGVFVLPLREQLDLEQTLVADYRDGDIW